MVLGKEAPDSAPLALPCGGCLGCRTEKARAWALRCHLELQDHDSCVFTTLTYDDEHLPRSHLSSASPAYTHAAGFNPHTLEKHHLAKWLKRIRKAKRGKRLRFFAAGEYGERTARPHYHVLLYGASQADAQVIQDTWGKGHARTEEVTPARIAYTAGYCQKKIGYARLPRRVTDPETGELLYDWQPPFIQMSRNPGIGANAKQWPDSWRLFGVHNGRQLPVPRYLHQAWKDIATDDQLEDLDHTKSKIKLSRSRDLSYESLHAAEEIAQAKHTLRSARRASF